MQLLLMLAAAVLCASSAHFGVKAQHILCRCHESSALAISLSAVSHPMSRVVPGLDSITYCGAGQKGLA